MKRDSHWWWFLIASAVITAVSSRMDLLEPLLPAQHSDKAHALIELAALIAGIVGGVLRASPLPDRGRKKYMADRVKVSDRRP